MNLGAPISTTALSAAGCRSHRLSLSSSTPSWPKFTISSLYRRRWRSGPTGINPSHHFLCSMSTSSAGSPEPLPEKPKPQPWLVVGLGNPGKLYNGTRHNVGFEMVDAIAEAEGISMSSVSFKALFGKGFIGNVPVMLAKPQTFMNASGESVGAIVSFYKIPLKQVLVIFDDMDLPFAKLRLLPKGGHGGHNGMRSIIDHFKGSRDFPRLRIGIGRPPGKMIPSSFVLRPFNKVERTELDFTLQNGVEAVRILVLEGFDKSATLVNSAKPLQQFS
ncbi:PREDICTED: peptidyl-tRNA hydrolase, mitochondrial-like [Ipomoea nil]|uniref:peptidyl-tRNA hydrolase, mitochondrial-like n=1 Tax=Ipomoea nil TaxID=35883 RepID=UPI000901D70C|nr:PREDICTED: peptidyl-tRNA hydrolase, mitochondrial-like [Ipomoea nil]